jgi:hypothetical protein
MNNFQIGYQLIKIPFVDLRQCNVYDTTEKLKVSVPKNTVRFKSRNF